MRMCSILLHLLIHFLVLFLLLVILRRVLIDRFHLIIVQYLSGYVVALQVHVDAALVRLLRVLPHAVMPWGAVGPDSLL